MAKTLVESYSFNPGTRAVTIEGYGSTLSKYGVTSIRNSATNEVYYMASQVNQVSMTGKVFTLPAGYFSALPNSTDPLAIYYDPELVPETLPVIAAEATDADTTMALANDLRAKLIDLGLVAES